MLPSLLQDALVRTLLQEVDDPSATVLAEVLVSVNSNLGPLWVDHPITRTRVPHWIFWINFALEGMSAGHPHLPKTSRITRNRLMFLSGLHVTQRHCLLLPTFVRSWIVPMSGCLTYRPKILCPRQVRGGSMHGDLCSPPVHVRLAFATHALLLSGTTHCACSYKTPKPGA